MKTDCLKEQFRCLKMIANIVVVVILATSLATSSQALSRLEPCSQLDQLKPDPKNCSRFYECTLAGWVGNACNPGLEFNPDTLYCDYPQNVKCANETSLGNDLKLEPCTILDELIPDPQNCSRFYECTLNGLVGLFCYPGLEFNPVTLQCDYPENVQCANQSAVAVPEQVPETYEPCIIVDELKPDPKNCSRFYECVEAGYWVGEPCNVGLLFNPDTLECDYPENVKCATELQNDERKIPIFCGPANYDQLFPDPLNCNGFLECSSLGLVPFRCPSNLRFNPATSVCDWPWKVGCSN